MKLESTMKSAGLLLLVWLLVISGLTATTFAAESTATAVTVNHLRCEYRVGPLGIDAARPRLSWILDSVLVRLHDSPQRRQSMSEDIDGKVQVIQNTLYAKASREPAAQFTGLWHNLLKRQWVGVATDRVLQNRGSRTAGMDGKTRADYRDEKHYSDLTHSLIEELRTNAYRPQPVRRVYIPKANGKLRPLGIPMPGSYCISCC